MQQVLIRVLTIPCLLVFITGMSQSQSALDSLELLTSNCYQKAAPGVVAISISPLEAESSVEAATLADEASSTLDLKHVGDELMGELVKRIMGATHEAENPSIGLTREDIRTGIYHHVESASGIGLVAHEIDSGSDVQPASGNLTANEGAAPAGANREKTAGADAGIPRTRSADMASNGRKGTGFIIRDDGTIVTIGDLFRGFGDNPRIVITYFDGRTATAALRGIDPHTNIAVLRPDLPGGKALAIGDSRSLRVGRLLVAVNCPYGLPPSAQVGIISGLDRKIGPLEKLGTRYERYIQTDLPLHPGGHGGPVLDRSERVVGMMAATVRQGDWSEVTFAIPSDILVPIVDEIIERGSVARGYLGVSLAAVPLGDKLFSDPGVIISEIEEGSPAALANLSPGDRILRVGDMETNNTDEFVWSIARHRPGESVALSVFREGRQLTIPIVLSERDGEKN